MFFKRMKKKLNENLAYNRELDWANVYHDSIRGKEHLLNLPLNIGRWAGSYSFFYILNRILNEYKPTSILELGLGESTKFIATYGKHYLELKNHTVVEHDDEWISIFQQNFQISSFTKILQFDLEEKQINNYSSTSYSGLEKEITEKFDLYIVDGPFGSDRFSRHNIVDLAMNFNTDDEFIILMDDCDRKGEMDTVNDLIKLLNKKNIKFYTRKYIGLKGQFLIVTEKYKFTTSF
jgi:hypothetical protein